MKNKYLLKLILILIFIVYICSYYISNSTYYEYELHRKTIITNEKIKEFENDIKNNKDISLKDYYEEEDNDYHNKITDFIYNISDKGVKVLRKGMKYIFKKISSSMDED